MQVRPAAGGSAMIVLWAAAASYDVVAAAGPCMQACMVDPVVAADGNSYERVAIQSWLLDRGAVSPTTGATLPHTGLTPNHALRSFLAHPARSR